MSAFHTTQLSIDPKWYITDLSTKINSIGETTLELDSHADTCDLGCDALILLDYDRPSEMVLCPILWGINYHIFMPVRLDEILNSIVDTCLRFVYVYQKILHSLYLLFLRMSTLKGDVRVKIFHFTIFCFGRM